MQKGVIPAGHCCSIISYWLTCSWGLFAPEKSLKPHSTVANSSVSSLTSWLVLCIFDAWFIGTSFWGDKTFWLHSQLFWPPRPYCSCHSHHSDQLYTPSIWLQVIGKYLLLVMSLAVVLLQPRWERRLVSPHCDRLHEKPEFDVCSQCVFSDSS